VSKGCADCAAFFIFPKPRWLIPAGFFYFREESMPEKELANSAYFFTDRLLWACVAIVVVGTVARALKSVEKVSLRVVAAESVLAGIGAIGIYAYADMQGMDVFAKIISSVLMSLGGIHGLQRGIQVWQTLKGGK
jgi:hypothetical protein